MTKSEAFKLVTVLKSLWPRQEVSQDTFAAYAGYLSDLDFDDAKAAIDRLVCSSKWFPSVAEIRAEIADAKTAELPDPEVAWAHVLKAIGRYGAYRVPEFGCPQLSQAVEAVGWRDVCLDENVMSTRARFIDAYRSIRERAVTAQRLGRYQAPERRLESGNKPLAKVLEGVFEKATGGEK